MCILCFSIKVIRKDYKPLKTWRNLGKYAYTNASTYQNMITKRLRVIFTELWMESIDVHEVEETKKSRKLFKLKDLENIVNQEQLEQYAILSL